MEGGSGRCPDPSNPEEIWVWVKEKAMRLRRCAPCLIIESGEAIGDIDEIIRWASEHGVTHHNGGSDYYIVQFPGRPMELYTEETLRRSLEELRRMQVGWCPRYAPT